MKRSFKGILSVCAAVTAFFALSVSADVQTTDQSEAREGNVLIEVPGTFYNKDHENILYKLNLIRYTACREGDPEIDEYNYKPTGKKLKLATDWGAAPTKDQLKSSNGDYVPLKWSAELEKISEIRSAEAVLCLDLVRPNSYYEGAISMTVNGYGFEALENVAWNDYKGLEEAIDTFALERDAWVRQTPNVTTGHYTNIISMNRTYVGMSCFRYGEDAEGAGPAYRYGSYTYRWGATALETSETPKAGSKYPTNMERTTYSTNLASYRMTETPRALTGKHTQLVEVSNKRVTAFKLKGKDHIQKGEEFELTPIVKLKIDGGCVPVEGSGSWKVHSGIEWSSSDTSVATVDQKGIVTGISDGTATITAKAGSLTANYRISVKRLKSLEGPDDIKVTAGCDVSEIKLPATVKGTWADGKTTDEAISWDTADLTQKALNTRAGTTIALRGRAGDLEVVQKIVVDPAEAKEIEFEKDVSTKSGTAPVLPEKARITWSNGEVTESAISWDELTKDDYTSRIGKTTVLKGSVEGQEISLSIKVLRPVLTKIEWISEPSKKVYQEGEKLDVNGGKISLVYDDGNSYELALSENLVDGFPDKPGNHTLSVSYEKQTITYDIRVEAKAAPTTAPVVTTKPAAPVVNPDNALVSGNTYKLSNGKAVFKSAGKQANVTIPESIKADGRIYKVTSIADSAFKGNLNIRKVIIGKNVSSIKADAFNGCKNLKGITVKSTKLKASTVGKNAFKGINKKAVFKLPKKKFKSYKAIFKRSAKSSKITFKKI